MPLPVAPSQNVPGLFVRSDRKPGCLRRAREQLDGRVLGYQRAARVDHGAEPVRGRLDLRGQIGRCASCRPRFLQSFEPRRAVLPRNPFGDRTRRPGVEATMPRRRRAGGRARTRNALPPAPRQGRDVRAAAPHGRLGRLRGGRRSVWNWRRASEPRPGQQPLPEAEHAVDLLRVFGRPPRRAGSGPPPPARPNGSGRCGRRPSQPQ